MENLHKTAIGAFSALLSIFAPVQALICCALVFVTIDFLTGIIAGYKRAQRRGSTWGFESEKAWKTIYKLVFIFGGIMLAWLIDHYILSFMELHLANIFTGFVCGVEFWSYLENAAEITQHPIFRRLRKEMQTRLDRELNAVAQEEA